MRFFAFVGVLAIVVAIAGLVYFFGGFYNVSAANGGNPAIEWSVAHVREASLGHYAKGPPAPSWFNDPKTIQAGAHEFTEEGCVRCHGAPGRKPDKFVQGMDPQPPDLGKANADDPPSFVFWIVKHGIRMTAMPAFGGHASDEEIWRAVAFVKHLKSITPLQYKEWSRAGEAGEHEGAAKGGEAQEHKSGEGAGAAPAQH